MRQCASHSTPINHSLTTPSYHPTHTSHARPTVFSSKSDYEGSNRTYLSTTGRALLMNHLANDYRTIAKLESMAINPFNGTYPPPADDAPLIHAHGTRRGLKKARQEAALLPSHRGDGYARSLPRKKRKRNVAPAAGRRGGARTGG